MSALDRLNDYSFRGGKKPKIPSVFNTKTPQGALLSLIHSKKGYKMYDRFYNLLPEYRHEDAVYDALDPDAKAEYDASLVLSEEDYFSADEDTRSRYSEEVVYSELYNVITTPGNQVVNAVAGSGKALANGTKVLTPEGYRPIESLKVGDFVISDDGRTYKVTGVFPQGECALNYVCFEDGTRIPCNSEHIWRVRIDKYISDVTTEQIASQLNSPFDQYIDCCSPIEVVHDMTMSERLDQLRNYICCPIVVEETWGYSLRFSALHDCTYVQFLAESLGMITRTDRVAGEYILSIVTRFKFDRSDVSDLATKYLASYRPMSRRITGVIRSNQMVQMTCISVDAPSHMYLTEHCIPTHNTTALVLKILHDIVTGEAMTVKTLPIGSSVRVVNKVWVCTFLRSGASELSSVLQKYQTELGYSQTAAQVNFSTMDAEFKRCLTAMGVELTIGSPEKLTSLMKRAIDACNITRDGYPLMKEDYRVIEGVVNYYRGRLDEKRYQHPNCEDYSLTPTILEMLTNQFASLRSSEKIVDFMEIMELLYRYLYVTPNKAVQDYVADRYNFIYIDEFQDTSQMAYAILKFYARGKLWINRGGTIAEGESVAEGLHTGFETLGKFVAVGDISQCIYSFRGSDSKILSEYVDKDFRPTLSSLSVNWRCPADILNPVVPSIHVNADSASQRIVSARQGGDFHAIAFPSFKTMIAQLQEDIAQDMKDGMSVAILCRTNFDGMIPAFVLEASHKFNFSISDEQMTLSSPLSRKIIGVATLFTERSTKSVRDALSFFSGRTSDWELKRLMDVLKTNHMTIWEIPKADLNYSCSTLVPVVEMVKTVIMPDGKTHDKTKDIEALKTLYHYMIINIFAKNTAYCLSARAYLETLLYVLDSKDFKTVHAFLEEIEYLDDALHGRMNKRDTSIQIATVHEFKGKERESVIIWNDVESVFPSSKCDANNEEQLAEERRVHYIACTRAQSRERIYTIAGREGMFVGEMDLAYEYPKPKGIALQKSSN